MVGLSPDFPVEQIQIQDCYPPELRSFVTNEVLRIMIERGHWKGETFFRHWQTEEAIPVSDEHFMIRERETGRVLGMGTITRDVTEQKRIENEQRFLADVGAVLTSTLDYEATLKNIARLAVRDLADFCIVDVDRRGRQPKRLKALSRDSSKASICDLFMQVPLDGKASTWRDLLLRAGIRFSWNISPRRRSPHFPKMSRTSRRFALPTSNPLSLSHSWHTASSWGRLS